MSDPLETQPFNPPSPVPPQPPAPAVGERPTRLRPVAIALFVIGLIIIPLGALKTINIELTSGAALCVFGIALFGLSFVRLPVIPNANEQPIPPLQKVFGIFYEPTRVFRNLRVHPHWVVAFLIIVALNIIYSNAFVRRVTPERIATHITDKMGEMGPPFAPPAEMLEGIKQKQLDQLRNPVQRVGNALSTVAGAFIWGGAISAITLLLILAFGGRINYWQALAVYFYSVLPIVLVQKLLSLVILYIKDPEDIHPILGQDNLVQDNLGVLFAPSVHPVLFVMASFIGFLSIYGLWLRGKGLREGGTKVSSTAGFGVAITLWVIGLMLVSIFTSLFPGFIG